LSGSSGAYCHALLLRLDDFSSTPSPLWVDDLPFPAADPRAERRRTAELTRPATGFRRVLLRYADGRADLVLVADRRSLDRAALHRLATGEPSATPTMPPVPEPVVTAEADWGLGDGEPGASGTHQVAETADGDEASWLAALGLTLSRYDGTSVQATQATLGALRASPAELPAYAALLFDSAAAEGEYLPCLAPPAPLTVSVFRDHHGWRLRCDHLLSQFAPAVVAQFLGHLSLVHRQILETPALPAADAVLLDTAGQARVAALGRPSTAPVAPPVTTVHEAFRRVAAAAPGAIALCEGDLRLTYRELDKRSDRLAAGLRARGVTAGDRVGVCLDRTAELVVTVLGVLKAGAAYVPADPRYPAERLAYTAGNAGLDIVVTRLANFPGESTAVTPDELLTTSGAIPDHTAPDDPAYVIYTSGSTGRPKGVVVAHRNVLSLIAATRDEYGLGGDDVWTLFHSSAFDFSVWEIWGCLLTGGRLVVVPYFVSREPDLFRDLLVSERVTVLSQTPSAFAQLLLVDHTGLVTRLVVFGGEPLDARMLLPWFDRHPGSVCRVVNMFGITETTVHVTAQTLTRGLAIAATRSVGRALPGWHLYIVDTRGRLVPPGVAGEICVGGAGVALGYLGMGELTAQRFRPDPFAGGTLYHSGDLGRLRPDGMLEHLGRIDGQVKVRGFRIELDEIRSVLLEDPDVTTAAVVVRNDAPGNTATARIDAYVVVATGNTGGIRERVSSILPEYMVPATITAVDALPLTTNGKLDPSKLPEPGLTTVSKVDGPPDDDNELAGQLTKLWSEVLGVAVSLDDDFFDLGGNSLLAIRIGAAMRTSGLPALRLRDLYRRPTVRSTVANLTTRK
jgi:amino acid adenylation domain-containing protein